MFKIENSKILDWIARVKVPPVPNLVTLAQRVSELEGKKRKCKSAPCGRTFDPRGGSTPWHSSQTKALLA